MNFSLSDVASAARSPLPGGSDVELSGDAVDSRKVRPGTLFVAIPGGTLEMGPSAREVADLVL